MKNNLEEMPFVAENGPNLGDMKNFDIKQMELKIESIEDEVSREVVQTWWQDIKEKIRDTRFLEVTKAVLLSTVIAISAFEIKNTVDLNKEYKAAKAIVEESIRQGDVDGAMQNYKNMLKIGGHVDLGSVFIAQGMGYQILQLAKKQGKNIGSLGVIINELGDSKFGKYERGTYEEKTMEGVYVERKIVRDRFQVSVDDLKS